MHGWESRQIVGPQPMRLTVWAPTVGAMEIQPGDRVQATNARGERHERVAVTGVIQGRDFPVVRIATIEEFDAAVREGREPESVAWPMEDVSPLSVVR